MYADWRKGKEQGYLFLEAKFNLSDVKSGKSSEFHYSECVGKTQREANEEICKKKNAMVEKSRVFKNLIFFAKLISCFFEKVRCKAEYPHNSTPNWVHSKQKLTKWKRQNNLISSFWQNYCRSGNLGLEQSRRRRHVNSCWQNIASRKAESSW